MNDAKLHADHVDETGAYAKRFNMIQELFADGILKEIPLEFSKKEDTQTNEILPVVQNSKFKFTDEYGNTHADHVDETGEYRRAWEEQFGSIETEQQETPANTEWKAFLQQLISEEKSKLNI